MILLKAAIANNYDATTAATGYGWGQLVADGAHQDCSPEPYPFMYVSLVLH
jgi:hypothetical protein